MLCKCYYYHGRNKQGVIEKNSVALFLGLKGDEMNLTMREKEMLVMFGCENQKLTHQRLGLACIWITDVLSKVAANRLRNKINNIPCDGWYIEMYHNAKEELDYSSNGKYVA